jgi:GT2 family glycosyltransferase
MRAGPRSPADLPGFIGESISAFRKEGQINNSQLEFDGFSEEHYLTAFPDIALAIKNGEWQSARDHYDAWGIREGRLGDARYLRAAASRDSAQFPAANIDTVFISLKGWVLIIGWIKDEAKPLRGVALVRGGEIASSTGCVGRCRRDDAATAVGARHGTLLGFWTVLPPEGLFSAASNYDIRLWAGDECKTFSVNAKLVDDEQLREVALEYFASTTYFGNRQADSVHQVEQGLGSVLVRLNIEITNRIVKGAYAASFGNGAGPLDGSIVVCLYGKAEFLFLQSALFSVCSAAGKYEFIFVSNSPELAEQLVKEATISSRIYGISITLVILPSNAGFGAANNVAVRHARSERILIVNPDVFPRTDSWAQDHTALIEALPRDHTRIFGVPLYYADGSLMHSGMYFDVDSGVSVRNGSVHPHEIIRVEHYAKGAPPATEEYLCSRPVPAVTGAFISMDRYWFEYIGGFSEEYVFGHYEDADLCLKSLKEGYPVWVHNLPFWHLEGKGSTRRLVHEGASTINRWHFTNAWGAVIGDGMLGPSPARLARILRGVDQRAVEQQSPAPTGAGKKTISRRGRRA